MSDLVERLRCDCDSDNCTFKLAAARIEQLEAALRVFACDCTISERCAVPDNCRNFQARRTMEAKCSSL